MLIPRGGGLVITWGLTRIHSICRRLVFLASVVANARILRRVAPRPVLAGKGPRRLAFVNFSRVLEAHPVNMQLPTQVPLLRMPWWCTIYSVVSTAYLGCWLRVAWAQSTVVPWDRYINTLDTLAKEPFFPRRAGSPTKTTTNNSITMVPVFSQGWGRAPAKKAHAA